MRRCSCGGWQVKTIGFLLLAFAILLFGATGEYVCGRIILPAVGLTAPDFWTWFWFMTFAVLFSIPLWIINKAMD